MALPVRFTELSKVYHAPSATFHNVIGVVVDILAPTRARKGQHMFTFKLMDRSLLGHFDGYQGSQGLSVRYFKDTLDELPKVQNLGDVVLIRHIKMSPFNNQPLLLGGFGNCVIVFPEAKIPDPNFEISFQDKHRIEGLGIPHDVQTLSLEEQTYIIALHQEMKGLVKILAKPNSNMMAVSNNELFLASNDEKRKRAGSDLCSAPKKLQASQTRKLQLVESLRHYAFADIYGQVVKKFSSTYGCELYITDYTENKGLFLYLDPDAKPTARERDGDSFGYSGQSKKAWAGPYGQLVLKVNVKSPHADYVHSEVQENDFVLLKNVKIKRMPQGNNLEGDMWRDDLHPDRVNVKKIFSLDRPEIEAILERKDRYWASRRPADPPPPKESKTGRKKRNKERRQQGAEAVTFKAATTGARTDDVNPYVRCSNEEIPTTSIRDIRDMDNTYHSNTTPDGVTYDLPFVNAKHRARVRCIDFAPRNLSEFAFCSNRYDEDDNGMPGTNSTDTLPAELYDYKWNFSLLLQDARPSRQAHTDPHKHDDTLWVTVGHAEAQYLLGNTVSDPTNLTGNPRLLAQLREKLCILWGNLAETKENNEPLSNVPFECCVSEFGINLNEDSTVACNAKLPPEHADHPVKWGWKRCYRMFGVTIL